MRAFEPAPAQTVFLSNGQECEFVGGGPGEWVVRPALGPGDEDGEPRFGRPITAYEVFAAPPVEKFDAHCAALAAKIKIEESRLADLVEARIGEERQIAERKARFATHEQLRRLDDFVSGRITHLVIADYAGPRIRTLQEALVDDSDCWSKKTKLVTLYGDSKGDLSWKLNQYRDGSGSKTVVHPATSEVEAREIASGLLDAAWKSIRGDISNGRSPNGVEYSRQAAVACGLTVPSDISAWIAAQAERKLDVMVGNARIVIREAEVIRAGLKVYRIKLYNKHTGDNMADAVQIGGSDKVAAAHLVILERSNGEHVIVKDANEGAAV